MVGLRFAGSGWGKEGSVFVNWDGVSARGGGLGGLCGWVWSNWFSFDGWVRSRVGLRWVCWVG